MTVAQDIAPNIAVRRAAPSDILSLTTLAQAYLEEEYAAGGQVGPSPVALARLMRALGARLAPKTGGVLLACRGPEILGLTSYSLDVARHPHRHTIYATTLFTYVVPAARRSRIAHRLLVFRDRVARQSGATLALTTVRAANTKAVGLVERNGYTPHGIIYQKALG